MPTYVYVLLTILSCFLYLLHSYLMWGDFLINNPIKVKHSACSDILLIDKQEVIRRYLFNKDCFINFNNYKINKLAKLLVKFDRENLKLHEERQLLKMLFEYDISLQDLMSFETDLDIQKNRKLRMFRKVKCYEQKNTKH